MKKQKFYRCACYLSSDIEVPELDMRINYFGRDSFLRQFDKPLSRYGFDSPEQKEAIIKRIEDVVSSRVSEVEAARRTRDTEDELGMCYIPFDAEVYNFKESNLDPEFVKAVKTVRSPASLPPSWVVSAEKEVYHIPLLAPAFAERLLQELDHFENSEMPKISPNILNNYSTVLSEVGFDELFVTPLREHYLTPLCRALFPGWTGARFDSHNAFAEACEPGHESRPGFHYDNAEVTLNVCLGRREFDGGELFFSDMRERPLADCSSTRPRCQKPAWAFLHRGQQLSGALSTLGGQRVNLVLWLRASEVRNRRCPLCGRPPTLVEAADGGYGDGFTASSPAQESAALKTPHFPLIRPTVSSERLDSVDVCAQ
ncbi:2-oxoglutarate and iron-dependent oxygenase domain-containing protein 2-like [Amblyomma americanum]